MQTAVNMRGESLGNQAVKTILNSNTTQANSYF